MENFVQYRHKNQINTTQDFTCIRQVYKNLASKSPDKCNLTTNGHHFVQFENWIDLNINR